MEFSLGIGLNSLDFSKSESKDDLIIKLKDGAGNVTGDGMKVMGFFSSAVAKIGVIEFAA